MTETANCTEYERNLRHSLGIMLIKPDALEEGIAEVLIDYTHQKLKAKVADIELTGAILIPFFNERQVKKIYPDLDDRFINAFNAFYKEGPLVVVFWSSNSAQQDLWSLLRTIRGKVNQGSGLEDSIRSIIPLPGLGRRERYEEITRKLENRDLNDEDYIELCKTLVHVPEDIKEFAGLLLSIDQPEIIEVLGSDKTRELTAKLSSYTS